MMDEREKIVAFMRFCANVASNLADAGGHDRAICKLQQSTLLEYAAMIERGDHWRMKKPGGASPVAEGDAP